MNKGAMVAVFAVSAVLVGGLGYVAGSSLSRGRGISADVSTSGNSQIKVLSDKSLTLRTIGTNTYQIVEPVGISSGFGLQLLNVPSTVKPDWTSGSDIGRIILNKAATMGAFYPMTVGGHSINVKEGNKKIIVNFSTSGYPTTSPTPSPMPSRTNTASPVPTATQTIKNGITFDVNYNSSWQNNVRSLTVNEGENFTLKVTMANGVPNDLTWNTSQGGGLTGDDYIGIEKTGADVNAVYLKVTAKKTGDDNIQFSAKSGADYFQVTVKTLIVGQ